MLDNVVKIYDKEKMPPKLDNKLRIILLTDTHLVLKNPNNRIRMIEEGVDILNQIHDLIIDNNIDIAIHLGDLYDRGYATIPHEMYNRQIEALQNISKAVNNNFFMVMGNHSYTYATQNPEFTITEILDENLKEIYKYKDTLELLNPIIKAPAYLDFGDTRISFVHFDPRKKYKIINDKKYNIALLHDDFITFESKEELYHHKYGHGIEVMNTDLFDNIDTAIMGHIHKPLTDFTMNNAKATDIIVPGSLVNRTAAEKHTYVDLPIIEMNMNEIESGKKPYRLDKIRFYLPKFDESFDLKIVEENKQMYEYAKMIKKAKIEGKKDNLLEEFIKDLKNPKVEELIRTADTLEHLESEKLFLEFKKVYHKRGEKVG